MQSDSFFSSHEEMYRPRYGNPASLPMATGREVPLLGGESHSPIPGTPGRNRDTDHEENDITQHRLCGKEFSWATFYKLGNLLQKRSTLFCSKYVIMSLDQATSRKLSEKPAMDRNRSTDNISLVHRTVMRMWGGWAMWGEGHITQKALRIRDRRCQL